MMSIFIDFSMIDKFGSQKINFFYDFLKFDFDWSIILKLKNQSLIPREVFGTKFNFEQLSIVAFFEVMRIFGRSPKLNVILQF